MSVASSLPSASDIPVTITLFPDGPWEPLGRDPIGPEPFSELPEYLGAPKVFRSATMALESGSRTKYVKPADLGGFSPVTFEGNYRNRPNVIGASCVVVEFDGTTTIEDVRGKLAAGGLAYCIYTSFNHQHDGRDYFRAIVSVSRPLSADEYDAAWAQLNELCGGLADDKARDASRFWYGPAHVEGRPFLCVSGQGAPLNADTLHVTVRESKARVSHVEPAGENAPIPVDVNTARGQKSLTRARAWLEGQEPCISGDGGQGRLFNVALQLIRYYLLSASDACDLLMEHGGYNERCQPEWSEAEIRHKLADARDRSDKPSGGIDLEDWWLRFTATEPERGQTAEHTDLRNAERLIELAGDGLRFVGSWGKGLAWDGARWSVDEDGGWERAAKQSARIAYEEATAAAEPFRKAFEEAKAAEKAAYIELDANRAKAALRIAKAALDRAEADVRWAKRSQDASRIRSTIALARTDARVAVSHDRLDADPWLLNVENGTIDLRTGDLRPHDRGDLMTKLAPVEYDSHASCPTWDAFLLRAMAGDAEMVRYLARLVGYSLTGLSQEHILAFLYGTGANGKSVFMGTVHALLGDYATPAPRGLLFRSRGDRHPTELASLHGRRFVTCSEIEEGQAFDEALMKDLTGGDSIEARRMREDFWSFTPTHTLWIAGNHKPTVRGDDEGVWRRIMLIPWTVTIPKEERDPNLPAKLRAEIPGILAWAVRGCLEWQHGGLRAPVVVTDATQAYREESDLLGQFLAESCKVDQGGKVPRHVFREAYEKYCKETGAEPLGAKRFTARIRELGEETTMRWNVPPSSRWENGAKTELPGRMKVVPAWKGIRMLTDDEKEAPDGGRPIPAPASEEIKPFATLWECAHMLTDEGNDGQRAERSKL